MLPNKTYVYCAEISARGRRLFKEELTVLLCVNASGMKKIKPLIIGKAAKLRSFANKVWPPVCYSSAKSVWMSSNIFKNWFHNDLVPQVGIVK